MTPLEPELNAAHVMTPNIEVKTNAAYIPTPAIPMEANECYASSTTAPYQQYATPTREEKSSSTFEVDNYDYVV